MCVCDQFKLYEKYLIISLSFLACVCVCDIGTSNFSDELVLYVLN